MKPILILMKIFKKKNLIYCIAGCLELKKKAKRERGGLTRRGFGLQSLNVNGHKNMSHPYLYTEQIFRGCDLRLRNLFEHQKIPIWLTH